jgi:predicted aspartyl protease
VRFDRRDRLILIRAVIHGPLGRLNLRLALDTGSTRTVIDPLRLSAIGINRDDCTGTLKMTTASGSGEAQLVTIPRLQSLGLDWHDPTIARYRLPSGLAFDGLLGLDVLRDIRLTIDFKRGEITATR